MSAAAEGNLPSPGGPSPGESPSPEPTDGMVISGRLEESSFAELLRQILASRDTAVVELAQGNLRKAAWILEGRIVFATSTHPDDRLGECMLRLGLISVEQYDESARLIRPGKRQGTILVELGYVTTDDLVVGVERQVERIVLDMFRWRAGDYRIELRSFETQELIHLAISTEQLIFTGVKAAAGWSHVRRVLGNLEMVLTQAPDAGARLYRLDLSADDMHAYSLANGRLTVAECCAMSYASAHDTCIALYGLTCCGLLVPVVVSRAEVERRAREVESEFSGIRSRVLVFDRTLSELRPALLQSLGARTAEFHEGIIDALLDEHHDVLRDVRLVEGLSLPVVIENVESVQAGQRCLLVERALVALERELVRGVAKVLGPGAGEQVAAVFGAQGRSA